MEASGVDPDDAELRPGVPKTGGVEPKRDRAWLVLTDAESLGSPGDPAAEVGWAGLVCRPQNPANTKATTIHHNAIVTIAGRIHQRGACDFVEHVVANRVCCA